MEVKKLSPSDINQFISCPKRWRYNKEPLLSTIAVRNPKSSFGAAVHNIIVLYFNKISSRPTDHEIERTIEEAFREGESYALKGLAVRKKRVMKNLIEFEKKRRRTWKQYKPTFTEKKLTAKLFPNLPEFRGIIDLYCKEDAIGVDWKTGGFDMNEDYMRQGKIYEMLLIKNGYPCRKFIFVSLFTGVNPAVPMITDGWIFKTASRVVGMAKANRFPKEPSGLCNYCGHQLRCELEGRCLWLGT